MAADNNILRGNAIRELEKLAKQSSGVSFSGSRSCLHWKKDEDTELSQLETEYNRLKQQKQDLLEQAEESSLLNELQEYIDHGDENDGSLGKFANENTLFKALELTKKRKLIETYNMYRLAGMAFVELDKNCLRFCLDTFYQGQYFEPYYMEIQIKDDVKIMKHTIPFFIPIQELFKKYINPDDIKEFVTVINTHLNAFVSRRQQFLEVQESNEHFVIRDFYSTTAFDFVQFTLKFSNHETQDIAVKMKYADLKDKLPTEVDLKIIDNDNEELLIDLKENLLSTDVKKAIMMLIC